MIVRIQAARTFGCEVDTLTLSKEQKALAEERIRALGLQDRIRVHLMDYREIPAEFEKAFDAFISIEMLEVRTFLTSYIAPLLTPLLACGLQALPLILQACRLCLEVTKCDRCCQRFDVPRIKIQ